MISNQKTARTAGILYLMVAISAGFAHFFARVNLIVPGDAAATVSSIKASETLFRMGLISDLIAQVCFLFLLLALYKLFRPVSENHALVMVLIAIIGVPITCVNLLNQYAVIELLSGADYLKAYSADQLNGLVMMFLGLHDVGYAVAHVFFGLWLLPLGFLVYKSNFLPGFFGIMLMIGAFAYLIVFLTGFLLPAYVDTVAPIYIQPALAEISFCLWLLTKGIRIQPSN